MQDGMGTDRVRVRRKIRWFRLFLVLFLFLFTLAALAGASAYVYYTFCDVPASADNKTPGIIDRNINILLLGLDDGDENYPNAPKRSDTMIVASVNPKDGTVNLLSIPRDTQVNIPGQDGYDKINHAFALGGPDLSERAVEELLNVPIDDYVVINWQGFIKVVDILGGVDLYVEHDMDYDDPYANLSIHLKKGYQHLDGTMAGEYVRFRHDELGDIGRVQRQQRFLKALNDEMFSFGTILKLPSLIMTLKQYVVTDMTTMTLLRVANTVKGFNASVLHTEMLPGDFATIDGLSYWVPNQDQIKLMVASVFPAVHHP